MLKTRVVSAVVGLLILSAVLLLNMNFVFKFALLIIVWIGLNEFYNAMKVSSKSFKILGFLGAIPLIYSYQEPKIFYLTWFLLMLASFTLVILDYQNKKVRDVYTTLMGLFFVPFLMSHLAKVYDLSYGNMLIWLIFISAWSTDTFAYLFGMKFGKHKISPISPKKSWEGSIAGLLGCITLIVLYGLFINAQFNMSYSIYDYLVIGIIGGIISQIGDFSASLLKRSEDIKDFGKIMPGHGGVLDRFDSVLFIAPAIYFYIIFFMV